MILYMSFYSKGEQIKATSKIIMANNIGMLCGFITSTILYDLVGMKIICLFSLIAGLIGFGLSFSLESVKVSTSAKIKVIDLLKVATDKNLIIFSILALVQQGVQMATTMSFTNQLITNLGASNLLVGISSIIYMISAVLFAKLASTKLLMLLSIKNWIYISFFALGLYCLLVPQANSVFLIYLLQIIPGMGTGILFSLLTSEALKNIDSQKRSTAMGFYQAVYAIGMTTLPIISGYLNESFSMQIAFSFLAGICFIAIFIAIVYFKISSKHKNKEPQVSSSKVNL
ncbi:major facilitator superfamily transporter [compost metagenome]